MKIKLTVPGETPEARAYLDAVEDIFNREFPDFYTDLLFEFMATGSVVIGGEIIRTQGNGSLPEGSKW